MDLLKPLTYVPVRYFLPLAWIVAVMIASSYAYYSVKNKHTKNALESRHIQELNFFEHSKDTASHALKTVKMKHLKKIFTLFSTEKERTLGLFSFKEGHDISPTNLMLMLEYDGLSATQTFRELKSSLCIEDKIVTLEIESGLWYMFSTIGDDCTDLLYFERVNVIDKIAHHQDHFYELVMKILGGLLLAMILIRVVIYFIFHKRLAALLAMMKRSNETLTQQSILIEGNDEIAEISKAFNAASHQLSGILNDMYTFVALVDAKGKILFINNTPLEVSGLKFEDVHNTQFCEALWWSYSSELKQDVSFMINKALGGEKIEDEIQIEVAKKQRIWIHFSLHPVYNDEGHLLHLVAEGVDITRQKEAYEKLLEQNPKAQMGEMMDAVAHQWKQPLNALSLQADLLKEDFNNGEINSDYIDRLTEDTFSQIKHMEMTLSEFRSFLRPTKEVSYVKLIDIIKSVQLLLKDEFMQHNIEIEVMVDEKIELLVNKSEFKHILLNILNNAKDAFNEKEIVDRHIRIHASKVDGKMTLKVEDNAGGIKASVIRHIFENGFTTKEAGEGTGIGLYLSLEIIKKLGGNMSVENVEDGACFLIEI